MDLVKNIAFILCVIQDNFYEPCLVGRNLKNIYNEFEVKEKFKKATTKI